MEFWLFFFSFLFRFIWISNFLSVVFKRRNCVEVLAIVVHQSLSFKELSMMDYQQPFGLFFVFLRDRFYVRNAGAYGAMTTPPPCARPNGDIHHPVSQCVGVVTAAAAARQKGCVCRRWLSLYIRGWRWDDTPSVSICTLWATMIVNIQKSRQNKSVSCGRVNRETTPKWKLLGNF